MLKLAQTETLNIGYEDNGAGQPVLLLHGWPDSARAWNDVTATLTTNGYQTIVPYLRGFGPTEFRAGATMRSGQIAALAQDAVDLLDALCIERVPVVGHDWGARAGYVLAALFPERVERLIVLATAYETGIKPGDAIKPVQAHAFWYQWFWHTAQGKEALEGNRREACRYLWQTWAPHMTFSDEEFAATAKAWDNPDWVEVTMHSYRVRWGAALRDPAYEALEARLVSHPKIDVPTILLHGDADGVSLVDSSARQESMFTNSYSRIVLPGVGHFPHRERPSAVVDAILGG